MRDRILLGGRIRFEGARRGSPPAALGLSRGRIVAAGSEREVRSYPLRDPELVRLDGAAVLPGFVEAHCHLKAYSIACENLDLEGIATMEEAVEKVAERAARALPGTWILGRGWNKNLWPGPRTPDRAPLDRAAPAQPVALWSHDGHVLWANRRALEETGFWSQVPAGDGGRFEIDPDTCEPTGIVTERMADLVREKLPLPDRVATRRAIRAGLDRLARLGITTAHTFEGCDDLSIYQELEHERELPLRLVVHFAEEELHHAIKLGLRSGFGSDRLALGGVKVYLDGALGSQTAHFLEPYAGLGGNHGVEVTTREAFSLIAAEAQGAGIVPIVHAIGDRANRVALDVFETYPAPPGLAFPRRIEHAQTLHPDDVPRFGRLGVLASMQPCHIFQDIATAERYLEGRARRSFPLASLARAGAAIAFGSDAPIEDPDPRRGLFAAVTRQRPDGTPAGGWTPEERIGIEAALDAYTQGGALASGFAGRRGRVQPGFDADLVVLSRDPAEVEPDELLGLRVLRTIVAGEDVFAEG
ncbi:MAG: amidohydrolase [Planctomycetes bacterium]|nr:amidohydrolase [Planctomycetota bacterium]